MQTKQDLVDICFQIALTVKSNAKLKKMSNEKLAEWVADQLRAFGFDTTPVGSSWGQLINKEHSNE